MRRKLRVGPGKRVIGFGYGSDLFRICIVFGWGLFGYRSNSSLCYFWIDSDSDRFNFESGEYRIGLILDQFDIGPVQYSGHWFFRVWVQFGLLFSGRFGYGVGSIWIG